MHKFKVLSLILLFTAFSAFAGTYTRQHSDTIVTGLKISATDLNDEFDAIRDAVNAVDSTNVTDGSLIAADFAATSTAYTSDRKVGCELTRAASQSISILTPCEIFMDGVRSVLSATQTITLGANLEEGSAAAATFYFVYGRNSSGDVQGHISTTSPSYDDARKRTDDTAKYLGTIRTLDSSVDIIDFKQSGERFTWKVTPAEDQDAITNLQLNRTSAQATGTSSFLTPTHHDSFLLQYEAFGSAFPMQCGLSFSKNDHIQDYQAVVIATGNNGHLGYVPFPVDLDSDGEISMGVLNISNCDSGRVTVRGWIDPPHFHR